MFIIVREPKLEFPYTDEQLDSMPDDEIKSAVKKFEESNAKFIANLDEGICPECGKEARIKEVKYYIVEEGIIFDNKTYDTGEKVSYSCKSCSFEFIIFHEFPIGSHLKIGDQISVKYTSVADFFRYRNLGVPIRS